MSKLLLISEVLPETRFWKVKVTVIEKSEPIENPGKATRQRIVFCDSRNNKVQAAIFAENIELFKDDFELHKTYFLSNAMVKEVEQRYRISTYPYQWTITGKSSVELCREEPSNVQVSLVKYTSFTEFEQLAGSNADVDIIAVVIHISPRRLKNIKPDKESVIQELIVIDKSENAVFLTLWDQYADEEGTTIANLGIGSVPVIVANRLRVSEFGGFSLSTKTGSALIVNPPSVEAENLRQWASDKLPYLQNLANELLENPHRQQMIQVSPSQPTTPISKAKQKAQLERYFWTKATLIIENFNQPFQYTGCKKCKRATGVRVNTSFHCNKCRVKSDSFANGRIDVLLKDESGEVPAQIYGDLAERVFGYKAVDFAIRQENFQNVKFINSDFTFPLGQEPHIIQIRAQDGQRNQEKQLVVNCVPDAMNLEPLKNTGSEAAIPLLDAKQDCSGKHQESQSHVAKRLTFSKDTIDAISTDSSVLIKSNHPIAATSSQSKPSLITKHKENISDVTSTLLADEGKPAPKHSDLIPSLITAKQIHTSGMVESNLQSNPTVTSAIIPPHSGKRPLTSESEAQQQKKDVMLSKTTLQLIEAHQIKKERIEVNESEMSKMQASQRKDHKRGRKK